MIDSAVIFFAAILAVAAVWYALRQARITVPQGVRWTAAVASLVLLVGLAIGAAWGRADLARLTWPGVWWRWIFDGTGALVLAGLIAGSVLVRALRNRPEVPQYGGPSDLWRNLSAAIGPALLVVALFLLASPGLLRGLGLRQVQVGEVALNLAPAPELPSTIQSRIIPPTGNPPSGGRIGWLPILEDIAAAPAGPDHPSFPNASKMISRSSPSAIHSAQPLLVTKCYPRPYSSSKSYSTACDP